MEHYLKDEERRLQVQRCLQKKQGKHPSDKTKEYSGVNEIQMHWNPRTFKNNLAFCKVCLKTGTPLKVLMCLKTHTKTFCWFCFQLLSNTSAAIEAHNREKEHFLNEDDRTVLCPFSICPETECLNKAFYFMKDIKLHIIKEHLPKLDQVISKMESSRKNNQPKKYKYCGFSESVKLLLQKPAPMTKVFVCSLCYSIFRYREELENHQFKERCSFMTGKFCCKCQLSFDRFTIAATMLHMTSCQNTGN